MSLGGPSSHQAQCPSESQDESEIQTRVAETRNTSPTAAIPIPRDALDLEQGDDLAATLVNEDDAGPSSPRSTWAGLTSMSLGAFSGEARKGRGHDRDR